LDRTKGEASAKCQKEEMNFLSLNLLNDIVTGKRTLEDAKNFYAQTAEQFKKSLNRFGCPVIFNCLNKLVNSPYS
jgi:hypothetical protein